MNDMAFVERAQRLLASHCVDTWISGGWGEELRGLVRPREHADLDLLYPAESWDEVDACADGRLELVFEAGDVLDRVAEQGDLFEPVLTMAQHLPAA